MRRTSCRLAVVALATLAPFSAASAQAAPRASSNQSMIVGSVDDSTGVPVRDVQVEVLGTRLRLATNEFGRFRIGGLRAGTYQLRARRLGFEPVEFEVELGDRDTVTVAVELRVAVRDLGKVVVTADPLSPRLMDVGFDQRRRFLGVPPSQFVTRADIDRRNPVVLSQMLRTMSGRAQVCANGLVFVDGVRMGTLTETAEAQRDTASQSRTGPMTRLSGMSGMGFDASPPSRAKDQIDFIAPAMVEGMEVYVGSAQIPPQYKTAGRANATSACVILIWTG